jgi:ribosomal protein L3 glutamine methyltransferase
LTLRKLIRQTECRLRAVRVHFGHGTDNAHDEAAFLVLRGLGLPFDADLGRPVKANAVESLVKKRIQQRIPAAYLLNEAWLDGVPFYVDRRVIIPRSHIPFVLRELRIAPRRILDLCTGSGCLAILAARAFPGARVDASDISAAALSVAKKNVRKHGLEKTIELVKSDLFASLEKQRYDLIVSNPPYVSTLSLRRLPPEYRHEPGIALGGGQDGLQLVSQILAQAPRHLTAGGLLVCEVGDNKQALRRAYPRTDLLWPKDEVFILQASRTAAASRTPPTRSRAR